MRSSEKGGEQQWLQMDERDGLISWLRGEFAAANAIIDALCHHVRVVGGEAGEYDGVIACVQQRRANWSPVLHMQQYFSVSEVIYALHQVQLKKQHLRDFDTKRGTRPSRNRELVGNPETNSSMKSSVCIEAGGDLQSEVDKTDDKDDLNSGGSQIVENESDPIQVSSEKKNAPVVPKTFVATEIHEGKPVNVIDGLKLYEGLLSSSEVSNLVTLVNDLRAAGRRRQLPAQTFIVSKRPMKGHGREMIQLGLPIADAPPEDEATSKDGKIEAIPGLFQDIVERLSGMQALTVKPDACVIDIFNERDHSQPHMWPHWYSRPITMLLLTECEMTFGKVIRADHPGDYRGSLKLSFAPGSILVMQGRSTDLAKHAIPSLWKQRILVTFTKVQPRKMKSGDGPQWVPPAGSRSPNHIRHPFGVKPYGAPVPTANILPQLAPPNGIQPIFVPAASPMHFPTAVGLPSTSAGWAGAPPPRGVPLPGTGVFLPPSGDNLPAQDNSSSAEKENADDSIASLKDNKLYSEIVTQGCNGKNDADKTVADEEQG